MPEGPRTPFQSPFSGHPRGMRGALLLLSACLWAAPARAGNGREAPVVTGLSLPTAGGASLKTPSIPGLTSLPDIPQLPRSLVTGQAQAVMGQAQAKTALPAAQAQGVPTGPQAQAAAQAGEDDFSGLMGYEAALPAVDVAWAAQQQGGDVQAAGAAAFDGFAKRGFELEYAVNAAPKAPENKLPASVYASALSKLAKVFKLSAPKAVPDNKYKAGHSAASASDASGREWKAIPEEVSGVKYDGVEVVTPPLTSKADVEKLALAHDENLAGALLVKGMSSSLHATFDVSHLIGPGGEASRLVDAILFIEGSWKELYAAASPVRYGTIVNRFSVPLGADHPGLLHELAALPRSQRTMDNVRAVFDRYHEAETARWGGHPGKAWKMRAANYGKLFGLQAGYEEAPLPVVEFRISDLPEAAFLPKLSELFAAMVTRAPPMAAFTPSFESASIAEMNRAVASQDRGRYEAFLERLELPKADYPFLGAMAPLPERPSHHLVAEAAMKAVLKQVPFTARLAVASLQAGTRAEQEARLPVFLRDRDQSVREAASELLVEGMKEPLWAALWQAAHDAYSEVRYNVATALMNLDGPVAAAIIAKFLGDFDERVRSWAWGALGKQTSAESVDIFRQLLSHEDAQVRQEAERKLELRSDPEALSLRQERLRAAIEAEKKMLSSGR